MHILLWVCIGLALNHLSSQYFLRADLTSQQLYTLSEVTKKSVRSLDRPLRVRVYFTEKLQAPYNNHRQALLDKLEELQALSHGKMSIESFDPDTDPKLVKEAQDFGIEPIPYRYKKGSLLEARNVYMGLALFYGERQMAVGPLVSPDTMEYELVRAIRTLTGDPKKRKTIGYLISEGEPDLAKFKKGNPLATFYEVVNERHAVQAISLGGDDNPLENVDALLVMGPQQTMSPRALYQLDQFLLSGKPVSIFLSSYQPDFRSMRAQPIRHGMNNLLGHYGIRLNKDAIVDRKHNEKFNVPVTSGTRTRQVAINYPLIPVTTLINHDHLLGRELHRAVLPFASSVAFADELRPGLEGDILISTSKESGAIASLRHIRPDAFRVTAPGERPGPHPVALTLTGRLTSFFMDQPVPPPEGMVPDDPRFKSDPTQTIVDGAPSRILLVASTDFMANNLPFMLNAVDWMLDDPELMGIRSKFSPAQPMTRPEDMQVIGYRAAILGFPLLLLAGLGLLMALITRRRR
jgi:gliding-associated putative ABC transporter substrate-binding component GldG